MNSKRQNSLNILKIRFPLCAVLSIIHRVTGVLMFLCLPFISVLFFMSLYSEAEFNKAILLLSKPALRIALLFFLSFLAFHVVAGIRHLIMDCGFMESKKGGFASACVVLAVVASACVFIFSHFNYHF